MRIVVWAFVAVLALAACSDEPSTGPVTDPQDAGSGPMLDDAGTNPQGTADSGGPVASRDGGAPMADVEPETVPGCEGATRYELPVDTAARGPWAVGARTFQVGRLTVEVWYPAAWGSADDASQVRYDIREALPPSQQGVIPDEDNPTQVCSCYRDLPIDSEHGPYPVIAFVHGTAAFRTQSLTQMTHWASRGFVVVSADHPGLWLADTLAFACPDEASGNRDTTNDVRAVLDAVAAGQGDLSFLADRVDMTRIGVVGHSAGGGTAASLSERAGVQVVIPMAAGSGVANDSLGATMYLGGTVDSVARYSQIVSAYEGAPGRKYLVGLENGGHLAFSDLCATRNAAGKDILEIANDYGICGANLAGFLFDCDPAQLDAREGWDIINDATSAVLEDVLYCADKADYLEGIAGRHSSVSEFRSAN